MSENYTPEQTVKIGRHVTWVGFWVNAFLAVGKILAGIFGRSSAMVADGVHSLSDFVTDLIVIIFLGLSRKKADDDHRYGHGKYETLATLLVSVLLIIVGIAFFAEGADKTWRAFHGEELPQPTWLALGACLVSIGSKEWLFHYTRRWGERIHSSSVIANAWHHRSDALSSLATLVGVAGAMFLGPHWRVLDPLAAVVVSIFIIIVGVQLARPALNEMLEHSLPEETVLAMYHVIGSTPGVMAFHHFASRMNGNTMMIDFHIKVAPRTTVEHAHDIATEVERKLRADFGDNMVVNIHIEPYHGEEVDENRCTSD